MIKENHDGIVQIEAAAEYEKANKGTFKKYPSLELVRLENLFFKEPNKGKLLEYAFGDGCNTLHLLECGYEVYGLDVAREALNSTNKRLSNYPKLKKKIKLNILPLDATTIPYPDNYFSFGVALSILSLLGTEIKVRLLLSELKRVMAPKGKIILDINDHDSEFSKGKKQIEKNVFLSKPMDNEIKCFCLENEKDFKNLIEDYFDIEDVGFSSHKIFGKRINEWLICAIKS